MLGFRAPFSFISATILAFVASAGLVASANGSKPGGAHRGPAATTAAVAPAIVSESFTGAASTPNLWSGFGGACLTAGGTSTPTTSIPACGANAPVDPAGSGALQLTNNANFQFGSVVSQSAFGTANGFQIVFTDAAFDTNSTAGRDGLVMFLSDASQGLPAPVNSEIGGYLGYVNLVGGYLGVAFDEHGNFSSVNGTGGGGNGFPGKTPETVAVRGSYASGDQYLGGYTGTTGKAQSLPFNLDSVASTTRPANAPTMRVTLLPSGLLTIEIDIHDGNGYRMEYSHSTIGVGGQPALPAQVYLGFAASTGSTATVHQIYNLSVSQASTASAPGPVISEAFDGAATSPNLWSLSGGACLTAGGTATPASSIPACGAAAPVAAAGTGALQLTNGSASQFGAIVSRTSLSTALGFQAIFTDAAFNAGGATGADGLVFFLSDASQALPAPQTPGNDGYLGFVGLAGGYVGVAFDEFGDFSSFNGQGSTGTGFPGQIPETVAVRGAFAAGNPYLGGYTGTTGTAQSLPFKLDAPASTTRPALAPTARITVTPAGFLTVEIDPHDGNGYRTVVAQTIGGVNGEPALPAQVNVGFAASTGTVAQTHQIYGLTVTPLAPTATTFVPTQIPNLAGWYDASDPTTLAVNGSSVSSWADKSGNGNTLVQSAAASMPLTGQNLDGLNVLTFAGQNFLTSANAAFSSNIFNASTMFIVTNATATTIANSVTSTGVPPTASSPRWELRLSDLGVSHFDFNNKGQGRLAATQPYAGPAFWTAAGSATAEYLRKDGNTIATNTGPGGTDSGNYPLTIGGVLATNGHLTSQYLGSVGEVLIFNRFLSTAESRSVEGYLACKWGMQNRLPENHPYRSVCPGALAAAPIPTPAPSPSSSAVPIVPEIRSANGALSVVVVARPDASGNPQLTWNGSTVPPTLRVLPGDIVSVALTNALPAMPAGSPYLNDVNLHFHGLHVSPNAPGDDSIDMLALPGQTLNYNFTIPVNHPTGLYWYHSHAHGEAERQVLNGMSGAFIVDGIASYAPAVANMPERVLIVRDVQPPGVALPNADRRQINAMGWALSHANRRYGAPMNLASGRGSMTMGQGTAVRSSDSRLSRNPFVIVDPKFRRFARRPFAAGDGHCVGAETPAKNWTVNGVTQPSIGIRPGEQQFWRVVNAGADTYLDLAVDNAQMQIIALDGVQLASGINTPQSITLNDFVLPPSSRVEFIVTGPAAGTTSFLRTLCFDAGASGAAMPAATLAVLNPTSSISDMVRPKQRISRKMVAYHFPRVAQPELHLKRSLQLGKGGTVPLGTVPVSATQTLFYSDQNTINGQSYDPGAPPQFYAQTGTVQEWTVVNNSSQVHTFHIHQIHFVIEAINGVAQSQEFVWDNINVPAASASGPGSVKLLLDFTDPTLIGTFLLHCHILSHEDGGMMAKIRVGTAPPLTTSSGTVNFANPTATAQTVTIAGGQAPYSIAGCAGVANGSIAGQTVTLSPTAAGSCVFTIADSTGLTATVTVNVNAAANALTVQPTSLSFASSSAAAQNATVSGGTPPYSVTGCNGIATAAINASENGVGVSPVAPGSCSLTIADSNSATTTLAVSINAANTAQPDDNVTFHHDAGRTGWYSSEPALTTTNVASTKFGLLGTIAAPAGMPAFGKVYAQPLYVQNETASDGLKHNLVIIATSTDQIYAIDETSGAVVWETNFTNAAAGIRQQLFTDDGCDDVNPNIGITGTPVIDRTLDRLFVVVPTYENGTDHMRLHALALGSGADVVSPVEVTASVTLASGGTATVSAKTNFNRSSLLEANGNIYVPLGSHCDFSAPTTHGWLLSYSNSTLAATGNALDTTRSNSGSNFLGSLWGSGFGPAADASGNIFFATGNGPFDGVSNFSMSILRVPGNLDITKANTFTPFGEAGDSASDRDLASGGVVLLPTVNATTPRLAIAGGKCGAGSANSGTQGCMKYLLNRDSLGGQQSGDVGAIWQGNVGGGLWGGPATFQDANGVNYVVLGTGTPISTYSLNLSPLALVVQSAGNPGCLECRDQGSQPIVSSNGTTAGTAVVWALQTPGNSGGNISLYAFDAFNMNHTLFKGVAGTWTPASGASYIGGALVSPTVANGRVYVPTDGGVAVFGLSQ